jgi:hypothetical protein
VPPQIEQFCAAQPGVAAHAVSSRPAHVGGGDGHVVIQMIAAPGSAQPTYTSPPQQ